MQRYTFFFFIHCTSIFLYSLLHQTIFCSSPTFPVPFLFIGPSIFFFLPTEPFTFLISNFTLSLNTYISLFPSMPPPLLVPSSSLPVPSTSTCSISILLFTPCPHLFLPVPVPISQCSLSQAHPPSSSSPL